MPKIGSDFVKRGQRLRSRASKIALFDYCQRLGDDALILGQRLGEWCGHAPALEVDLSLANLALDLIGQGTHFLGVAGDADKLAFHRDVLDWKNCLLVEQPNGDFAQTIARQLLFSTWQHLLYQQLDRISATRICGEFAAKARQGSRLSPRTGGRMDRSGWATGPRKARGEWPRGSTGAGASSPNCSRSTRCSRD